MWVAFEKAFTDNGLSRKVGLLRTLTSTKLVDCTSVDDYVNRIVSTAHKLQSIGMTISEEWVGTLLFSDLPDIYSPMIMGIESSGVAITTDWIKTKILQDVRGNEGTSGEIAFFGK